MAFLFPPFFEAAAQHTRWCTSYTGPTAYSWPIIGSKSPQPLAKIAKP